MYAFWAPPCFSSFGSGTFSGADTFFSPNFIINPMQFAKEYKEIKALGFEPKSYFMSYCNSITTPFDMILNQIVEEQRGKISMVLLEWGYGKQ